MDRTGLFGYRLYVRVEIPLLSHNQANARDVQMRLHCLHPIIGSAAHYYSRNLLMLMEASSLFQPLLRHTALRSPDVLPAISPNVRLSQSSLEPVGDMFRLVCERKEAKDRLAAMENRIQSLRFAEAKAVKKLEETRRLRAAKAALREVKAKEEEHKRRFKEQRRSLEDGLRTLVNSQRTHMRDRLMQAKQTLFKAKKDTVDRLRRAREMYKAQFQAQMSEDLERKSDAKEYLVCSIKQAHARNLSLDSTTKERRKAHLQSRREAEVASKAAMEHRIRELEDVEAGLVEQLKQTFDEHEEEVRKLETMVTTSRLASSLDFAVPTWTESKCC